ncbi:MAG TPA: GGDEF domain-containing protein [Streptosporangiaceae bacterium]|jgi:diguanylate cyclase (GGDEF)-like protein|nr:GGDEF domain-containing protein [Streptosporangiaceae bacterium]
MEASLVTRRVLARADVRGWAWWQLPWLLRCYVGLVPAVAVVLTCLAAAETTWHATDLWKFALLLGCGLISVAATPRVVYRHGGMTRDFITVWVLPIAILLPPVYAMVTPIPLYVLTQMWVFRGVVYRRVFTVGAIGLAYGAASVLFRAFPASFAGGAIGTGMHALTWAVAVAIAEQVGRRGHQILIMGGIKLSNPSAKLIPQELNREALVADFAEFDLGVLITIVVAVSPVLAIFAVPTVLLVRRFMMHGQLLAQSRIDTKTGLLNASTWEQEATTEIARAVRTGIPLALALVDIDHFKVVNDTYGHLVGDKTLRAVTDALQSQLRAYDVAGRFGGEEFVILLPHAREVDALAVAERLRVHIASLVIPVDDSDASGPFVKVTISVGVAALDRSRRELTDMLNAADAALYHAKETGRNKTHMVTANAPAS